MAAAFRCAPRSTRRCSAWRASRSIDGLSPTIIGMGWRGPVKNIDIKGDWGKTLGCDAGLDDIDPWRLAVVLDVTKDKATIGLRPGAHAGQAACQGA